MAPKDIATSSGLLGLKVILQPIVLTNDKKIAKLKEEEKIMTLKEEENIFASKMEDKKRIKMEEHHKVKILVGEPFPNVPHEEIVSKDKRFLIYTCVLL